MEYLVHYALVIAYIETPNLKQVSKLHGDYTPPYTRWLVREEWHRKLKLSEEVPQLTGTEFGGNYMATGYRKPDNPHGTQLYMIFYQQINKLFATHLVDTASCRQCGRSDTLLHRLKECAHVRDLGMDAAPISNDTMRRSEVYSKWLAPNAVFPIFVPAKTASNIVELSTLCLVQNGRAATTNTCGLHRLYVTLAMIRKPHVSKKWGTA